MIISSGVSTKKKAVLSRSVRMPGAGLDALPDVLELGQDLVLVQGVLVALDVRRHLVVLPHLLAQGGDLLDPGVVDAGHGEVVERVAQGHQVVDVVVVAPGQ